MRSLPHSSQFDLECALSAFEPLQNRDKNADFPTATSPGEQLDMSQVKIVPKMGFLFQADCKVGCNFTVLEESGFCHMSNQIVDLCYVLSKKNTCTANSNRFCCAVLTIFKMAKN